MDADGWKRIFNVKTIWKKLSRSMQSVAEVFKKICSAENQSSSSEAFLVCPLIPLEKNHGLRLIGID